MGNHSSCLCLQKSTEKGVVIMKEDGEPITFAPGTHVKEVLAVHPYHKMIRYGSDRSVLPAAFLLSRHQLYFLLPEGLAVCDATYDSLVRIAVSQELILSTAIKEKGGQKPSSDSSRVNNGYAIVDRDWVECKKLPWKPVLQTIPEVASPLPHATMCK